MKYANEVTVEELKKDREFLRVYLAEACDSFYGNERRVACLMIRDIVHATIGFKALSEKLEVSDKTIMGKLTGKSNPTVNGLFDIINAIIEHENFVVNTRFEEHEAA